MTDERPAKRVYAAAASRGLTFEALRRLVEDGADAALCSRSTDRLALARRLLEDARPGATVLTIQADLRRVTDQDRLLNTLEREGFSPDVVLCGAGQTPRASILDVTREAWNESTEMLLGQAVFAVKTFVPRMAERGYGRFVFFSSLAAKVPSAFSTAHALSAILRPGLFALSKLVTADYAARGVASFVICPGYVDSPLLRNLASGRPLEEGEPMDRESWAPRYEEWSAGIPARSIGDPQDLAALVSFLVSREAAYLSGNVLSFAGGLDGALL